jgi:arsenate reductase (thioredoxin)
VQEDIMVHDLETMPLDTKLAVSAAKQRLHDEFAGKVGEESVDAVLQASWDHIDAGARIKHHVPLLAERFARGQLWALAHMHGDDGVPAVLFLDTHDGGRAKMAKGLLLAQVGDAVHAFSAGTDPEIDVVPAVLEAMHEVGVSLEQSFPKPYTEEMLEAADLVVTFGDGEPVAASNGTPHEHWDVPDPRGLSLDQVRAIREDISQRITDLVSRLPAAVTAP